MEKSKLSWKINVSVQTSLHPKQPHVNIVVKHFILVAIGVVFIKKKKKHLLKFRLTMQGG